MARNLSVLGVRIPSEAEKKPKGLGIYTKMMVVTSYEEIYKGQMLIFRYYQDGSYVGEIDPDTFKAYLKDGRRILATGVTKSGRFMLHTKDCIGEEITVSAKAYGQIV
jgi:hypothetical protein